MKNAFSRISLDQLGREKVFDISYFKLMDRMIYI